jgi:enoyl-CoA hydratase/carnithine racemase
MAKAEFNTVIKTLKIFLVPVVAAVHGTTLFSLQWKPAVLGAE